MILQMFCCVLKYSNEFVWTKIYVKKCDDERGAHSEQAQSDGLKWYRKRMGWRGESRKFANFISLESEQCEKLLHKQAISFVQ